MDGIEMLNYTKLSKKPIAFRRFTGFTIEEYDKIYEKIESQYPKYENKRLDREDRKRAIGGGRNFDLELEAHSYIESGAVAP